MTDRQTDRQTDRRRLIIAYICALVVVIALCGAVLWKLYKHEKWQSEQIHGMQDELTSAQEELATTNQSLDLLKASLSAEAKTWKSESYNYFAIGNSITKHSICDYWWNEVGMAASTEENDYVHRLVQSLQTEYDSIDYAAYNFSTWETNSQDRYQTLQLLDSYLSTDIDLITIQLGENASDITTFAADYIDLIQYVQDACPDAEVLVIGEFWTDEQKEQAKKEACAECGVTFVDLSEIQGQEEYQAGLGTVVYDADGNAHTIEHDGVAAHPGDEGMEWIAEAILESLEQQ